VTRNDPKKLAAVAAAVVAALLVIWWMRPPKVANRESKGTSIIAFGDSLTAGYGAKEGEDFPSRLSTALGAPIVNAGVSGDTTEAALARLDEAVLTQNPRIVIVGLGGNDYLRRIELSATEANLRAIIRRIHSAGAAVVLLGFRFPSISANYEKMYERIAEDEQCLLIPDLLDGILANSSLKSDEIHPNGAGYQLMAERIEGPLKKLMK
jgi:lysophospholipase L1-like esterase